MSAKSRWIVGGCACAVLSAWWTAEIGVAARVPLGIFAADSDVGVPATIGKGHASFDAARNVYTVSGGGDNMWANADHFHYVWKKMSGDVALEATFAFVGTQPSTGTPAGHRKACLVIRQTLDSDAVYADAAAHGDGLTSLQWRDTKGAVTHEVQSNAVGPKHLRIEKHGHYVSMWIGAPGEALQPAGGQARVEFTGDFYVGLGVTSHDTGRIETVAFSNVQMTTPQSAPTVATARTNIINTLETMNVQSGNRRVAYVMTQTGRLEAPNWFPDATNTLYFNNNGKFYKVEAEPPGSTPNPNRLKVPEAVDLGILTRINNDHGVTADGKMWAFSDQSQTVGGQRASLVYTMPVGGGEVKRLTEQGPSYFHGWSPDGKTLVYCAQRNGNFDVYAISVNGGPEKRLTSAEGKDDGPEYSPDGQYIYFNSERTGTMQIWRMKPDGSDQEQITKDTDVESWFPHVSPDNKSMVFLTYDKGAGDHPENKDVALMLMDLSTRNSRLLTRLFGGQGTINVASWSPNSRYIAFVGYQLLPQ